MLNKAVTRTASEPEIVEECVEFLNEKLAGNAEYEATDDAYVCGSIRLLDYVFRSQGKAGETVAKRIPFVVSDNDIVRWSRDRMLMAPVSKWHASAQPFSLAYPPDRVLAGQYAGVTDRDVPDVTGALAAWGIVFRDPIASNKPAELKDRRLAAIAEDNELVRGMVVSGCQFSQIALLQPELINRCRSGIDEARALLGLILCHVAPNDPCWKESRTVVGRKAGTDIPVTVRGALWLADLSFQAWVPVPDDEGNLNQMTASASTLQNLLEPSWLEHNDAAITLLSGWFGFDELDLRLLGTAPDPERRQALRNGLARLVETAGADPGVYEALAEEVEVRRRRQRDIGRCRRLGLAVQDAIRQALEARNLRLTLIDRGYDFEVIPQSDDVLTGAACRLEVGPYLLEVKATTTGQARMTPSQAATARAEAARYVLCVVDLRTISPDRLDGEWAATDVEPLAILVEDIGGAVAETCQHIDNARQSDVAICNEQALRYEVPVHVWSRGTSIKDWAEKVSALPVPEAIPASDGAQA
jgi:hypothetical protein